MLHMREIRCQNLTLLLFLVPFFVLLLNKVQSGDGLFFLIRRVFVFFFINFLLVLLLEIFGLWVVGTLPEEGYIDGDQVTSKYILLVLHSVLPGHVHKRNFRSGTQDFFLLLFSVILENFLLLSFIYSQEPVPGFNFPGHFLNVWIAFMWELLENGIVCPHCLYQHLIELHHCEAWVGIRRLPVHVVSIGDSKHSRDQFVRVLQHEGQLFLEHRRDRNPSDVGLK
mmetsp:Transcript_32145/g.59853  ORF Transcript_32145/g.59853 Transcript_32145/m.59853 type:complete len:225 (-) Transcript_32145:972-1646(-)